MLEVITVSGVLTSKSSLSTEMSQSVRGRGLFVSLGLLQAKNSELMVQTTEGPSSTRTRGPSQQPQSAAAQKAGLVPTLVGPLD